MIIEITALFWYNMSMNTEMKSSAEWQALLEKKEDEITTLHRQVEWLTQQLRLMRGQRFGASSERTQVISEQISLFNEAEADSDIPESDLEQITYKRKKRAGKREMDFSGLPVEQIIHELPEAERVCLECGGPLHKCGQSVLRRELAYVPAQYKVVEHIQTAYSCRCCEQKNDHVPMKKSVVPPALFPGSGVVSPGLLAHILNSKYVLALPLYRQEQEFQRVGVSISRQTMANWILAVHEKWFSDFFQLLRRELLANSILHADETTLMVLREPGRKAQQKSYVWVYRTSGDSQRPVVLYDYQPTRAGECASNFLSGFSGMLHTDGYEAYHCKLPPEITVVGCWAHMRRKFTDTLKSLPADLRSRSPAQVGLDFCNKLFGLEESYGKQGLFFEERQLARTEQSVPVAKAFFVWAKTEHKKNPVPKSMLGAALTYAVRQESWLMNVFLDGRLELSNNRAERSVRPFALGRKNWLFSNTPKGADASAAIYSLVETAKANGLKPFAYLNFLLVRLANGIKMEECLPWTSLAQKLCKS
ncbi:IS66 family transposase [Colidextribacter sp. OB.20]|uniref:IS66 family transposase n=1 Tax=Colidextribacter sp. OB.20 TaxID=2304568 RepID=UPI0013714B73|nr:IS66 family transposase [Colidextribacter sp. OB.20]